MVATFVHVAVHDGIEVSERRSYDPLLFSFTGRFHNWHALNRFYAENIGARWLAIEELASVVTQNRYANPSNSLRCTDLLDALMTVAWADGRFTTAESRAIADVRDCLLTCS